MIIVGKVATEVEVSEQQLARTLIGAIEHKFGLTNCYLHFDEIATDRDADGNVVAPIVLRKASEEELAALKTMLFLAQTFL